jgi:hypothetical protein
MNHRTFVRIVLSISLACGIATGATLASAAEAPKAVKAPKCKIVYINGDMVITCPKAPTPAKRIFQAHY